MIKKRATKKSIDIEKFLKIAISLFTLLFLIIGGLNFHIDVYVQNAFFNNTIVNTTTTYTTITPSTTTTILDVDEHSESQISDNIQFINDSNVYLASTSVMNLSGWSTTKLISKTYTGNIDIAYGFNSSSAKPTKARLLSPHNVSVEHSYTCSTDYFNYTLSPNHFWCWENITEFVDNVSVGSHLELIYDHDFETGDIPTKTAYWTTLKEEQYKDITGIWTPLEYTYDGKDLWYFAKDLPVVAGVEYEMQFWLDIKIKLGVNEGKYDIAIKPSGESIHEAITNGHFYILDPWWNLSFAHRNLITLTSTKTVHDQPFCLNVSSINRTTEYIALVRNDSGTFNTDTWNYRNTRNGASGAMRLDNDTICWTVNLTANIETHWYLYTEQDGTTDYNTSWYIWHDGFEGGGLEGWINTTTTGFGTTTGLVGDQAITLTESAANHGAYVDMTAVDSGNIYFGFMGKWGVGADDHLWLSDVGSAGHQVLDSVHFVATENVNDFRSYYSGDYRAFAELTVNNIYGMTFRVNTLGGSPVYNISVDGDLNLTTATSPGNDLFIQYVELYYGYGSPIYDEIWVTDGVPIMMYGTYPTAVIGAEEGFNELPICVSSAQSITLGETKWVNFSCNDADVGDSLTFASNLTTVMCSATFDTGNSSSYYNPYSSLVGTHNISLTCTDGKDTSYCSYILTVGNCTGGEAVTTGICPDTGVIGYQDTLYGTIGIR